MAAASVISGRGPPILRSKPIDGEIRAVPLCDGEARFELGMLMLDGTWQTRQVVWNKHVLHFARPGESVVVDLIPLHEIRSVSEMDDEIDSAKRKMSTMSIASMRSESDFSTFSSSEALRPASSTRGRLNRLQIKTIPSGFNSGRTYYLQASSQETCSAVVDQLTRQARRAARRAATKSRFQKFQLRAKFFQSSTVMQGFVAFLIIMNFAVNAAESQLSSSLYNNDGTLSSTGHVLEQLDMFFTIIFTVELFMNALANWFSDFIHDGWNIFDVIVVSLSLVALGPVPMPINVLRSIRAFRAIRIFGRMAALRDIISALTSAIVPVLNAFLILLVVACIYSILGTTFFAQVAPQNFARFDVSLLSMFTLAAGMGWIQTLPATNPDGTMNFGAVFFVASFVVLVNWTLLQVSVAVLLDCFITARGKAHQERSLKLSEDADRNTISNTLDPLLEKLGCDYVDDADLSLRLERLFKVLDTDDSGGLDNQEFSAGVKKLDFKPHIHISEAEFADFTQNGALCNEEGQLGMQEFCIAMRHQIKLYFQRRVSNALVSGALSRNESVQLGTLKAVYLEQSKMQEEQVLLRKEHTILESCIDEIRVDVSNISNDLRELMGLFRETNGTEHKEPSNKHFPIREVESRLKGRNNLLAVAERKLRKATSSDPDGIHCKLDKRLLTGNTVETAIGVLLQPSSLDVQPKPESAIEFKIKSVDKSAVVPCTCRRNSKISRGSPNPCHMNNVVDILENQCCENRMASQIPGDDNISSKIPMSTTICDEWLPECVGKNELNSNLIMHDTTTYIGVAADRSIGLNGQTPYPASSYNNSGRKLQIQAPATLDNNVEDTHAATVHHDHNEEQTCLNPAVRSHLVCGDAGDDKLDNFHIEAEIGFVQERIVAFTVERGGKLVTVPNLYCDLPPDDAVMIQDSAVLHPKVPPNSPPDAEASKEVTADEFFY